MKRILTTIATGAALVLMGGSGAFADTVSESFLNNTTGPFSTNTNSVGISQSSTNSLYNSTNCQNTANLNVNTGGNTSSFNTFGGTLQSGSVGSNLNFSCPNSGLGLLGSGFGTLPDTLRFNFSGGNSLTGPYSSNSNMFTSNSTNSNSLTNLFSSINNVSSVITTGNLEL